MYALSYILHIVGVAIWIGSFAVIGYLLKTLVNHEKRLEDYSPVIKRIQKWVMMGVLPSLLLILLSGVYMILQFNRDTMPLYLTIMEQGGTLIILLTIIFVSIYSVKLTKRLTGIQLKKEKTLAQITEVYANFLFISSLMGIGIIIVVGLRIV
jgi:putative copper export protein